MADLALLTNLFLADVVFFGRFLSNSSEAIIIFCKNNISLTL
jgi:hypothetical protein